MLSLGREYRHPFDYAAAWPGIACAIAVAAAALSLSRSAPFVRLAFIAAVLGVLLLAWRYRLAGAVALIIAVTAQLVNTAKGAGWRRLAIPFWAAFLVVLVLPVDISLRRATGAFGFVRVEDGVWLHEPPDVGSSNMVGLVCYGQHAPQWLWVW